MSTAMVYLLVACGGGIGALLRFCLVQMVAFPYGTLSVNVIGSFLMGLAFWNDLSAQWKKLVDWLSTGL